MLIGELSERSGISARMLRHYDRIGLVSPTGRTQGGYRDYSEEDARRLFHVEGLRSLGLSLREIAEVLEDLAFDPAPMIEQMIVSTRTRIAQEQELLDRLEQVRGRDPAAWSEVLGTIGLMRALDADDPSARQRLALALDREAETDVAALVDAVLRETDPNVAGALTWAIARRDEDAIPALVRALDAPGADRRRRAVEVLEKLGSPRAHAALGDAVANADPFVGSRAALARGALGDAAAVPALIALIVDGRYDVDAAETLGVLAADGGRAHQIVDAIVREIARTPVAARRRLAAALAEIPGDDAVAALTTIADDPDRGVALAASSVLRMRR
ncbi:MerR family transcriptional regulator [Agromyces sp. Leaf222]|uniref:MerR family transcriptional regulator n=1 Tax=Agromyces sp. Leaf222 TaxID=1735688 RepID=UPI0006F7026E|nr:MerR family transcriptional regulator [Agromyces sp. Leaf222]KQM82674.1 MerR family transcriptional regulator [Agromyces sp. Leaf222]